MDKIKLFHGTGDFLERKQIFSKQEAKKKKGQKYQ